ncbi:lipopolysaccharide biosynthesis protein [Kangiella sediminilitoris]|uniref:Polysaccharide biosynthesis protein n=1 Tax=Kangiella sediminilitoris TaxID=1144748 RepID=A0A1B3BBI6_9GAMM|nr:hypothetical protein [Kangiella sediminilitoris]AOE50151.1 hypothetical protein KS2013_1439 [Kangiella sediminilitoris]
MNKTSSLFFKAIPVGLSKSIAMSGAVVLQWVLAQHLTLTEVGNFVTLLVLLAGLSVVFRYGSDQLLLREGGHHYNQKDYNGLSAVFSILYRYVLKRGLLLTIVLTPILIYFLVYIQGTLTLYTSAVFILVAPFYGLLLLIAAFYRASERHVIAPLWEQGGVSLATTLVLILLWPFTAISFNTSLIIFLLLTLILAVPFAFKAFKNLGSDTDIHINDRIDFGWIQMSSFVTQWGVVIALGALGESEEVGLLTTSLRIAMLVNFILIVFNSFLGPKFAGYSYTDQMNKLKALAKRSSLMMFLIAIIPSSILFFASDSVLALFGSEYIAGALMLKVFVIAQLFNVFTGSVLVSLNMTGNQRYVRKLVMSTGAVTLVLIIPVVVYWGGLGAAIFIATVNIVSNLVGLIIAKRKLGFTTLPL